MSAHNAANMFIDLASTCGALPVELDAGGAVAVVDADIPEPGDAPFAELPSDLAITNISPVASLLMNNRPLLSHARPTGRKQLSGHFDRSGFDTMSTAAVLLFAGWVGKPFSKPTTDNL